MTHNLRIVVWVCVVTLALLAGPALLRGQDIEWIHQFGSGYYDYPQGVTSDASGVYIAGSTFGTFPGETHWGQSDAFVCKYNLGGTQLWCRQFGSYYVGSFDSAQGVASDGSGVYVVGGAGVGFLPGQTNVGAYVCKFDSAGNQVWCDQFGSGTYSGAFAVASDLSGVYVVGMGPIAGQPIADAFVCRYDSDGNQSWCRGYAAALGPRGDGYFGVTTDASGVYVLGLTKTPFPGQTQVGGDDAFLCKYDTEGNQALVPPVRHDERRPALWRGQRPQRNLRDRDYSRNLPRADQRGAR